jgi:hypothetical protein
VPSVVGITSPGVTGATAVIQPDGAILYTPPPDYVGNDSFTYEMSDGQGGTDTASVSIAVAAISDVLWQANFDDSENEFGFAPDSFRNTSQPAYTSGNHVATGGITGGALSVSLGGVDNNDITGMSGGWRRGFTLDEEADVTLLLYYNLTQSAEYESDEYSEVLVSVDGQLLGSGANDFVAQLTGDGNGGGEVSTGWQVVQLSLGRLAAGGHELVIGGYNNQKTYNTESTFLLIDDILLRSERVAAPAQP